MRFNYSYSLLLALAIFVLGFSSCDDDDGGDGNDVSNIAELVVDSPQFSTLLTALQRVNLDATLADETQVFTVFAPTNQAFTDSGINLDDLTDAELTEVLLYHVLGGNLPAADIPEGQTYVSTASANGPNNTALSILVVNTGGTIVINDAADVTLADIPASNGTVHEINSLLLPLDVVGHALANESFTALVGALGAADLVTTLQGDGPFTVFAPLNSAFTAIQATVDGLTTEQLTKVLLYHVIAGANVQQSGLAVGPVPTANAGETIDVTSISPVEITDATDNVITPVGFNVQATNGVIHVLDEVLIPGNL
jgi:transforming growth factor-beta-induced protein